MPQARQRPRRRRYETSGRLSSGAIGVAQDMQADAGRTTERRRGTRAATTFRKLPSASPGAKTAAAIAAVTLSRVLRRLREREDRLLARHADRDERESAEGRARGLAQLHGAAVERPVDERGRVDVDRIRAVQSALEVGAHELDAVAAWNLVVRGPARPVPVYDEAQQVLRRIPARGGT